MPRTIGIQNPAWNQESTAWNPDSMTVSDSLQIHGVKRAAATASKLALLQLTKRSTKTKFADREVLN